MFVMYDNVDLNLIPNGPHAVGCYRNGRYANEDQARKRFPHARILPISVTGDVPCDCYDIETGDYTPDYAAQLVKTALQHNIWRPCLYANLSTMPAVKHDLEANGVQRNEVRLWVAAYDGVPIIPAGYDAKQFTDRALGRSLDESVCNDTFFRPSSELAVAPHEPAEKVPAARVTFDPDSGEWTIAPEPLHTTPAGA